MTKVFAVIVTWNGEECVAKCLESLQRSTIPVHVIVVDNASCDETVRIARNVCPGTTVLRLRRNLGFGRANNIGIKHAYEEGAERVLLINQDAHIEPDVVRGLVELQRSNPTFGILSPLHRDGTGASLDGLFCEHWSRARSMRELLSDVFLHEQLADIYPVEFLNAAVWLLSRECIEKVGLFNPAFEHYGEDREYADRVNFFGFQFGVVPRLHAFHARLQNRPGDTVTIQRYLMQEKAVIRYRLSRRVPGTVFNILSAFSCAVLSSYSGKGSHLTDARIKTSLLASLFSCLPVMLRTKETAYRGGPCFFKDADFDSSRYLLSRQ
jgi:GT2 family glycosyltransferase